MRTEYLVATAALVGLLTAGAGTRLAAGLSTTICGGEVSGGVFTGVVALIGHLFGQGPSVTWTNTGPLAGTQTTAGELGGGVAGGWCYWPWVAVAVAAGVAAAVLVVIVADKVVPGPRVRHRFGQPTDSRQATAQDMAPMIVESVHSTNGRMVVGELIEPQTRRLSRRRRCRPVWLATEDPDRAPWQPTTQTSELDVRRQGSRGSVMLIGPSQSGKSSVTSGAIATWEGPVISVSVKGDVMQTMGARARRGEVAVFDPGGSTPFDTARWSPLQNVIDHATAVRAGAAMAAAIPAEGVDNGAFWKDHGENLLVAYVIVTALPRLLQADRWEPAGMTKLASWVNQRAGIDNSEIAQLVNAGLDPTEAVEVRQMASVAAQTLMAMASEDSKIKASVYTTAVTAVRPYLEAAVGLSATDVSAKSAATWPQDHHPYRPRFVDLNWLVEGDNTLYMTASSDEFARLSPVLGGMLGWLVNQIHEWDIAQRSLPRPLLIVIDEAAQVSLDWLPEELSTLAGLGAFFTTVWQSLAQVVATYGNQTGTVLANHRTKVFFAGVDDHDTLSAVNTVTGTEHIRRDTTSHNPGTLAASISSTVTPEDLLPAHVVRQMVPGDAVMFHGTLPPAHIRAARWWDDPDLSALINTAAGDEVPTCPLTTEPVGWESAVDISAIAATAAAFQQATTNVTAAAVAARTAIRDAGTDRSGTAATNGSAGSRPNIRPVNARCSTCSTLLRPHEGHRRLDDHNGATFTDWCDTCYQPHPH